MPGYGISSWGGLIAPKRTDPAIVAKISEAVQAAYKTPEIKAKFEAGGLGTAASSPQDFEALLLHDYTALGKVIKAAGIKVN